MKQQILLIDDLRNFPEVTQVARTYEDGIKALKSQNWDVLYLDHDLGQADGLDGTGVMNFLEENPHYLPKKIIIVSSNPVGRQRMQIIIEKLYKKA